MQLRSLRAITFKRLVTVTTTTALIREEMLIRTIARALNRTDSNNRFLYESDFPYVLNKIRPEKILHVCIYNSVKVGTGSRFSSCLFVSFVTAFKTHPEVFAGSNRMESSL